MAYPQQGHPSMGATFVPGGYDDFYLPQPGPELISPAPQRLMPEVPDQMQENLANLESEGGAGHRQSTYTSGQYGSAQYGQGGQYAQQAAPPAQPIQAYQQSSSSQPLPGQSMQSPPHPGGSSSYSQMAPHSNDIPHFSPFPKLTNPPPNVPPSDDEKEGILESARVPVLNSNDPEMQLAWAQDSLAFVAAAQTHEERLAENRPARPATPAVEHQLRVDAMSIVTFLAEQRHPKAEFMKGMWLEFGNFGWRQDKREAFRSYVRASEKGFYRADYRMGMQFEQNNDPIKALVHYQKGAANGDSASNYRLGMMTLMGQMGQAQDFAKGIQMLRIAAEHADENAPQGAYVLGMLQARELPQVTVTELLLPYNVQEARMNIEKAAYLGFAKAQLKMGSAYELCSLGCEFNPALSLHYNALAARQGEPDAEMAISKWFLCGQEGVFPKNEDLAFEYAQRAAQSGLATAEFAMGYFHEIGMHVPVNLDRAREWYDRAAKSGNQDAIGRIQSLNNSTVLSKQDHENVAVNKIKSQHGSMRGKRPDRLKAQAMPSISSEPEEYGPGGVTLPPRGSSITPYPMNDGPPLVAAPNNRPPTVAPYPLDNGPPNVPGGPGGFAGGFVPELRSHSAAPAQSRKSSGQPFNINPNVYDQGLPTDPYNRPYQGGPSGPGGQGRPMPRPATTLGPGDGVQGQRRPSPSHRPESGPPSMSGGYGPPNGGGGYGGPGRVSNQSSPNQRPQSAMQDIGYVAPLQTKKQSLIDQGGPGGAYPPRGTSRPQGQGQGPPQSQGGAYPSLSQTGRPQPGAPAGGGRVGSQPLPPVKQQNAQPTLPNMQAPSKASVPAKKPVSGAPAGTKPGKGPKTFDEMGVPQQKADGDCVMM